MSTLPSPAALAIPDKRGGLLIPASHRLLQPVNNLLRRLGMLSRKRSAHNDALQRLRHIQPGASNGRRERHDPMSKEPFGDLIGTMPSQVIPHEDHADGGIDATRWMPQPGLPLSQRRTGFIHGNDWMLLHPFLQDCFQLGFEPGM